MSTTADEIEAEALRLAGADYVALQVAANRLLTIAETRGHAHARRVQQPPRLDAARRWLPRCRQLVEATEPADA
jgi:hypothetical protein